MENMCRLKFSCHIEFSKGAHFIDLAHLLIGKDKSRLEELIEKNSFLKIGDHSIKDVDITNPGFLEKIAHGNPVGGLNPEDSLSWDFPGS